MVWLTGGSNFNTTWCCWRSSWTTRLLRGCICCQHRIHRAADAFGLRYTRLYCYILEIMPNCFSRTSGTPRNISSDAFRKASADLCQEYTFRRTTLLFVSPRKWLRFRLTNHHQNHTPRRCHCAHPYIQPRSSGSPQNPGYRPIPGDR